MLKIDPPTTSSSPSAHSVSTISSSPLKESEEDENVLPTTSTATAKPPALISRRYDAATVSFMAFNFFASTAIVFVNKVLFQNYGCSFSTFVTCCHFVMTFVGTLAAERAGMFQHKPLRHRDVFPITLAFCGFVVFNNLSLRYNSVGFYQLMKVMTTPTIVILQFLIYGVREDRRLVMALVPVIAGVIMATVNDFSFNMVGLAWASAGILSTSFYQMFVKSKQDSLGASSWQLLKYQAPQAAVVVFLVTPAFDDVWSSHGLISYLRDPLPGAIAMLTVSSLLAFCVNLSIYLVVGRTDPIAYNVLGHFKLLVILAGGILWMNEDRQPKRLIGMALAFAGITHYTNLKQGVASAWKQVSSSSSSSSSSAATTAAASSDGTKYTSGEHEMVQKQKKKKKGGNEEDTDEEKQRLNVG